MPNIKDLINEIRPTENEIGVLQATINSITRVLQNGSNLSVSKCIPGGSFAKNTMLKGNFEADVVYIINKDYDYEKLLNYVLDLIQGNFQNGKVQKTYKAINLKLEKPISNIDVDILPAFEVNSPLQMSQVSNSRYYAGSSSKFQVEYIKGIFKIDSDFGDFVRLLKLWKINNEVPLSGFQLELLASNVYMYKNEDNWSSYIFRFLQVARQMLNGENILPINDWFNINHISAKRNGKILIVDPGNPSNNVGATINSERESIIRQTIDRGLGFLGKNDWNSFFNFKYF